MKKLIPLLILIPFLAGVHSFSSGSTADFTAGSTITWGVAEESCTTSTDSKLANPVTQPGVTATNPAVSTWHAFKISLADTTTVTAYKIRVCDNNSDTGSVVASLYNHNAGTDKPTTEVSSSSSTVAASSIQACDTSAVIDFNLGTPLASVAAGTYWVVVQDASAAVHKVFLVASTGDRVCYGTNGTDWTCADNYEYDIELWGCQ